jgi:hypothetical protein
MCFFVLLNVFFFYTQGLSHRGAEDGELPVLQPAPPARGELELAAPRQSQVSIIRRSPTMLSLFHFPSSKFFFS